MTEKRTRNPSGSLWGDLDESARYAREQTESERVKRDVKSRRLKELRLAEQSDASATKGASRTPNLHSD